MKSYIRTATSLAFPESYRKFRLGYSKIKRLAGLTGSDVALLDYCINFLCYCWSRTLNDRYEGVKQQKLLIAPASLCLPLSSGCHLFSASLKKHQFVLVVIIKFFAKAALTPDNSWSNIKGGGFTEE